MRQKYMISTYIRLLIVAATIISSPLKASDLLPNNEAFDEGAARLGTKQSSRPFGSSLFTGKFNALKNNALDPNYIITTGDQISLHIWGEVQADEKVTVDTQGNIFLPDIGAVKVSGSPASQLPNIVKSRVRSVYKEGVEVYVNLVSSTPIKVFVTGSVDQPGQYSGSQTDSILAFLHQAGGIISNQGSYRDIRIIRKQKTIANVDLYAFLRWGQLPNIPFSNGDTILVTQQKSVVNVKGDARGNYQFELKGNKSTGRELITFSRPNNSVTNVAISGSRNRRPYSVYLNIGQFSRTTVADGDTVNFVSDAPTSTIDISIAGSHLGNSYFAAKKGTRLKELLDYVAISPDDADIYNIYIKRKSVAIRQKKNLEESIKRLERSILTAPATSDGEARIRSQEAGLLAEFIKNARSIQPEGNVIVSLDGQVSNIRLEDGDVIVIPHASDVIITSGEINIPQAIVYANNADLTYYLTKSGGLSERADKHRIMIKKPNGSVSLSKNSTLSPGDEIIVFPKIDTKSLQFTKDIMTIIFQVAAASSAVGIL